MINSYLKKKQNKQNAKDYQLIKVQLFSKGTKNKNEEPKSLFKSGSS